MHPSWLPRSRFHLFRKVSLHSRSSLIALHSVLTSPRIQDHLRCTRELLVEHDVAAEWAELVPELFAPHMRELESLALHDARFYGTAPHAPLFTSIASLTLVSCVFRTRNKLQCMLCGLPRLRELCMVAIAWRRRNAPDNSDPPPGNELRLRALHVEDVASGELCGLLDWLVSTASGLEATVRSLRLIPRDLKGWQVSASRLLVALGRSLEHVEIPIVRIDGDNLGLVHNTRLGTIRLRYRFSEPCARAMARISAMVNTIASRRLECFRLDIIFRLDLHSFNIERELQNFETDTVWARFDASITAGIFNNVKEAWIHLEWHLRESTSVESFDRAHRAFQAGLRQTLWERRGILKATHAVFNHE